MLNYIWGFMIIIGIITAVFTGKTDLITSAIITGGQDAVSLCITMLGVVPLWAGIMKIGEKAGLIDSLKDLLKPVLKFLFPTIPYNSRAMGFIAANIIANFLGLGWAATAPGLMAMKELKKLNGGVNEADKAMCMFLIIRYFPIILSYFL